MADVRLVAGVALLAVTTSACAGSSARPADAASPAAQPATAARPATPVSDPLPDAELARLGEPGTLRMSSLRGKPSVVNFWATWCPFCVDEMPEFERVHQEVAQDVRFVGIDLQDRENLALKLAEETGVTYELVTDPDGAYFRAIRGRGMPTTLFVDADGSIVRHQVGPMTGEQLRALIDELLLGG